MSRPKTAIALTQKAPAAVSSEEMLAALTPELLPSPLNQYAGAIGIHGLYNLCALICGENIYIPKPDALFKAYKKHLIRAEYRSGAGTMESLAHKYDVCIRTVQNYIKGR